jgi:hypothetical protein
MKSVADRAIRQGNRIFGAITVKYTGERRKRAAGDSMLMRVKIFMLIEKFEPTMNGKTSRNAFFNASLVHLDGMSAVGGLAYKRFPF